MKQKSIAQLKKILWPLVSKYIRERDGYVCMACGRPGEGSGIHAGHLVPRPLCGPLTYFHPLNLWAECYHDNINLGGNTAIMAERLSKRYRFNFVAHLEELRRKEKSMQWDRRVLEALIAGFDDGKDYAENFYKTMKLKSPIKVDNN